jgi:hypothetical protein
MCLSGSGLRLALMQCFFSFQEGIIKADSRIYALAGCIELSPQCCLLSTAMTAG